MSLLGLLAASGCLGASHASPPSTETTTPPRSRVAVPNVAGLSVLAAAADLQRAGFAVTIPSFYLSSQTPPPTVKRQSPIAGAMLMQGGAVALKLEGRCCIGSPGWSKTRPLLMPGVVGKPLDVALREVKNATGFFDVSLPQTHAALKPLLSTYRVTKQWPQPGFDLRHQADGVFRLPQLTVALA